MLIFLGLYNKNMFACGGNCKDLYLQGGPGARVRYIASARCEHPHNRSPPFLRAIGTLPLGGRLGMNAASAMDESK